MKWLSQIHGIHPDRTVRQSVSEEYRIKRALAAFSPATAVAQAINGYAGKLRQRQMEGKTSVRSVRLALTPAVGLLQLAVDSTHPLPNQVMLDRYLQSHPGQRAAITGFVNYLNSEFELNLKAQVDAARCRRRRRMRLERVLSAMIGQEHKHEDLLHRWVPVALEYFHNVKIPKHLVGSLLQSIEYVEDTGLELTVNGQTHYIPAPCDSEVTLPNTPSENS